MGSKANFERAVCSKCGFATNLSPMYLELNGRYCANCNEPFPVNFTALSKQNEQDLEAIASDSVEFVTKTQNLDVTNFGKSVIAKAIAEALKSTIADEPATKPQKETRRT